LARNDLQFAWRNQVNRLTILDLKKRLSLIDGKASHLLPVLASRAEIDGKSASLQDPVQASLFEYGSAYVLSKITYLSYFERVKHLAEQWEFLNPTKEEIRNSSR
jgi:hypothetical protein